VEVGVNPVSIRGTTYRSTAAAARALKVGVRKIENNLDRGTPDKIAPCQTHMKKPCMVDGVYYSSMSDASRAIGISVEAVRQRVKRNAAWLAKTAPVSPHVMAWRGLV
jgi:hypothetical protein